MFKKPQVLMRPSDPLLVTRELDVAYAVAWAIFAAWGFLATVNGLETITVLVGPVFNFIWSLGIALLSSVAAFMSIMLFFKTKTSQIAKKRIELAATWGLLFLIAVYPMYLGIRTVVTENNNLWASTAIAVLYVWVPFFRIRNLRYRIKYYAKSYPK